MDLQSILSNFNISELNEMQKSSLKSIQESENLILISPTGSGKTLAFLLPALALIKKDVIGVQVLIIVPTRELALQIEKVFKQMSTNYKINCCYGGHSMKIEVNNLIDPPAILVGTPGRIAHHIHRRNLSLNNTHLLILDEFDKSLEFGFKVEMEFIIQECKNLQKRVLTSATNLNEIPDFVGIKEYETLNFTNEHKELKSALQMKSVRVEGDDKVEGLVLLLSKLGSKSTIVFCNHRETVERISEQLKTYKIDHGTYHGGLDQIDRERTIIKVRNGSTTILVTTDLAARGLDIPEIEVIIHYHIPPTEDIMIHRNGRTARMHASGTSYFLLDQKDYLPPYLTEVPEVEVLPKEFNQPQSGEWKTLYIGAGKKDKINKMDIVGMLLQKGKLQKDELGKIDVLDHTAYAAIKKSKFENTLLMIKEEKIKNRKIKMEASK